MSIANLKFVITGAGQGIGAATARVAAAQGAQVCVSDINENPARDVVDEITRAGGKAWFIKCDICDSAQLDSLMHEAAAYMGGIDVLNNNAGVIDTAFGTLDDVTIENYNPEIWNKVIAINLTAPMFAVKAALPWLKKSSNGSVINAASTSSFVGYPSTLAYGASKGGIAQLTKSLAIALAPFGIRCNAYCPGPVKTPMNQSFINNSSNPAEVERSFLEANLIPRFGEAKEVGELICFLAGDACRYVNGVNWLIDGGMLAWRGTLDSIGM